MKINIAASHRFHLLDLARELEKLGHDVRFYSYVPTKRSIGFGLSKEASKSLLFLVFPFFALQKILPGSTTRITKYRNLILDLYVSSFSRKCDIFIGLGVVYLRSFKAAKNKGCVTVLEWGSKHILVQQKILKSINARLNNSYVNDRALGSYNICDYIAIPSEHVKESFVNQNIPADKLFVNPYGVDLSMFYPNFNMKKKYDAIMVGGWSLRKGCDMIIEAVTKLGINFLHVGSIIDIDFPDNPYFTHIDAVDQRHLVDYYNQARLFMLPSREEGLAMVQMQAITCNLPIICSRHSGGEDLKQYFGDTGAITVMEELTPSNLIDSIQEMMIFLKHYRDDYIFYNLEGKKQLTWEAYGKRYSDFLNKV